MTKEWYLCASDLALVRVKSQTSFSRTCHNSLEISIVIATIFLVSAHNYIICDTSDPGEATESFINFFLKMSCAQIRPNGSLRNLYLPCGELKVVTIELS